MAWLLAAVIVVLVVLVARLIVREARRDREIRQLAAGLQLPAGADLGAVGAAWRRRDRARADELEQQQGSLARLGNALDAVTQGVVVCDLDGRVIHANAFGAGFLRGRHGDVLVAEALHHLVRRALAGEAAEEEVALFGPPPRTMLVSAHPLHRDGEVDAAVALIDDVTEFHRLDAVRRDFVANVSHELKTPIGALSLLAETLEGEGDPEVIARLSERIVDEVTRVNRLIDDLLDLSRLESEAPLVRRVESVTSVVDEALGRVRALAASRGISLQCGPIEPDLAFEVEHKQLVSALQNLLENAVKYSDRSSEVEVRVAATDDEVAIAVEDHGIGIAAAHLDRIFERFYRADRARSRSTGGTGLGLSIVRHVMVNHGGSVQVVSKEGVGSTFTLLLPIRARAGATPTADASGAW